VRRGLFAPPCIESCAVVLRLQVVIREGEPGSDFYIIEEGSVAATKAGVEGEVSRRLTVGDYFGERALLTNEVRVGVLAVFFVKWFCCGQGVYVAPAL
jgi:CRP-like cAMP-binding protein